MCFAGKPGTSDGLVSRDLARDMSDCSGMMNFGDLPYGRLDRWQKVVLQGKRRIKQSREAFCYPHAMARLVVGDFPHGERLLTQPICA
jgi:hypothetical protein